jgi:hypothetical protein
MVTNEALNRVRTFQGSRGPRDSGTTQRHTAARRGAAQAGSAQSEPARPEAKTEGGHAFRFGPRRKRPLIGCLFFSHLAGDLGPRQALTHNLSDSQIKTVTVIHALSIVEPESLLVRSDGGETAQH